MHIIHTYRAILYQPKGDIRNSLSSILPALFILALCALALYSVPIGVDFTLLYPAGRAVWAGENPYLAAPAFFNPPWMLVFLAPLSLLPIQPARWLWMIFAVTGYLLAFRRMKLDAFAQVALMLSPFIYFDLGIGNYEWLILLGTTLAPAWGAWIAFLKPQMAIWWLLVWIRRGKWLVALPVVILAALFALGLYSLPAQGELPWSADVFPWGVPVGLWLLYLAYRRDDGLIALAAAPFLSPYLALQSWIFALLPLTRSRWGLVAGVIAAWIYAIWFLMFR